MAFITDKEVLKSGLPTSNSDSASLMLFGGKFLCRFSDAPLVFLIGTAKRTEQKRCAEPLARLRSRLPRIVAPLRRW